MKATCRTSRGPQRPGRPDPAVLLDPQHVRTYRWRSSNLGAAPVHVQPLLNSIYARARRRPCVTMFGIFEARTLSTQPVRRRCGMCGVYRMEPRCREPGTSTCELLSEGTRATADRTWDKDRACYAGIGTARRRVSTRSSIKILSRSSQHQKKRASGHLLQKTPSKCP